MDCDKADIGSYDFITNFYIDMMQFPVCFFSPRNTHFLKNSRFFRHGLRLLHAVCTESGINKNTYFIYRYKGAVEQKVIILCESA